MTAKQHGIIQPVKPNISAAIEGLIKKGKAAKSITFEDLNEALPDDQLTPEQLDRAIAMLERAGITVVGNEREREVEERNGEGALAGVLGRSYDAVDAYLNQIRNVQLLTREGEVELARRS